MNRRDALRTLALGAGATLTGSVCGSSGTGTNSREWIEALMASLPRNRAHVIVADPNARPGYVRDPMIEILQEKGVPLGLLQAGRPWDRHPGVLDRPPGMPERSQGGLEQDPGGMDQGQAVLVPSQPDLPIRRFRLEMRELDRQARQGRGMVLASWQLQEPVGADWIAWLGQVVGSVIRVRAPEFDEPPEVVPSSYRVPVEVFSGGGRTGYHLHQRIR